eukprot:12168087-Alexandrium_andersonii.AAC.1
MRKSVACESELHARVSRMRESVACESELHARSQRRATVSCVRESVARESELHARVSCVRESVACEGQLRASVTCACGCGGDILVQAEADLARPQRGVAAVAGVSALAVADCRSLPLSCAAAAAHFSSTEAHVSALAALLPPRAEVEEVPLEQAGRRRRPVARSPHLLDLPHECFL